MFAIAIPAFQPEAKLVALVGDLRALTGAPIVIIDDGSGEECRGFFEQAARIPAVTVLRHAINLGKGAALKTAFNYALCEWPELCGVVTADADGQHLPEDILRVAQRLEEEPDSLVLGTRVFDNDVPLRSRIGNTLTVGVMRIVTGQHLNDTQTGLRGVPRALLLHMLRILANGYEFELDMLLVCKHREIPIVGVPIRTVYIDQNRASHFNPLTDSLKIYFTLLRFGAVSLTTTAIDNTIFFTLTHHYGWVVWQAQATARLVALVFNYRAARRAVFLKESSSPLTFLKFVGLVVVSGLLSFALITLFTEEFDFRLMPAKLTAESLLFFLNFLVQRDLIFASKVTRERSANGSEPK
jgi:putative flippase GtrA